MKTTAAGEWNRLDSLRSGFITRCEQYAAYTLPRLCTERGFDQLTQELAHEWQSVGAQSVNHVVNKLVLALFAPSRPFIRLEADAKWKQSVIDQGMQESAIDEALAKGEIDATREMDRRGIRPKLYQAISNLVVLGNVLAYFPRSDKEDMRIFGIKNFVVRRTGTGKVKTLIIKEDLAFDELESDVQDAVRAAGVSYTKETKCSFYRFIERQRDGKYRMSQWVNNTRLGPEYDGYWPEDKLPWRALTWQLADSSDYGTGLVEDYSSDFAALSALSEAQVKGAILSSEFRWLVNPGGMTKPEDLEESENGAALPGLEGDVSLVANSKPGDLAVVKDVNAEYIRRIGYGFLLNSAVTRDAERVTAEEIRRQAQELETSFGGTYSNVAGNFQTPLADWLLQSIKLDLGGTKIQRIIITGLDALSRSGDLDALRAALADIAGVGNLPPPVLRTLKLDVINATIFAGHGLAAGKYTKTAEQINAEIQQEQAAMQQAEINTATAVNASGAAAEQIAQQGNPQGQVQ